jgi:RNA polymerase sigma factor (TIGR02999 family)
MTTDDRPRTPPAQELTDLLRAWEKGDPTAPDRLFSAVYGELRRLAASHLRRERSGHSLQPTALVHEVYLRLAGGQPRFEDRAHFFRVAARAMRRVLVDRARRRNARKRGQRPTLVTIDAALTTPVGGTDVLRVDEALTDLSTLDPRQSQIVELRFFGGLSIEETAEVLDLSAATVKRDWSTAKAWIARYLISETSSEP